MNDDDLDIALFTVRDIKKIPMVLWTKDQYAAVVLHDAFFQLQKIANELRNSPTAKSPTERGGEK